MLSDSVEGTSNIYEVLLGMGGNEYSVIRETMWGSNTVQVYTPGIVSCDELRYFWFRWKNDRLEVCIFFFNIKQTVKSLIKFTLFLIPLQPQFKAVEW